ncbi:MAG: hypothetical protein FJ087_19030, partial [Deltaproteobacteria bacterium]|nr:hypothetical protein [Deltaproteobacteria bacterium]
FSSWLARPTRRQVALWGLTAAATAFFLAFYDGDLLWEEACMVRASSEIVQGTLRPDLLSIATGGEPLSVYQSDPLFGHVPNRFLAFNQGQRIGPATLVASSLSLFGPFGFRVVFALQGLLLPGLGYLLGRRVVGREWAGWATAILLTFSPYGLGTRTYDENFLSLGFGSLALAFLLRPRVAAAAAGVATGMFLAIRHEAVLAMPFVAVFLLRGGWRPAAVFAVASLPTLLPEGILHSFLFRQDIGWFEGAINRPPAPHSFLGVPFDAPMLLGFPFVAEPVRSPYLAFPNFVAYPLDLAARFGVALAAFVPAGVAALFRADRRTGLLLVGWAAPLLAIVMVQSGWIEPNKMGIPATVLPPMVLAIVAGIAWAADRAVPITRRAAWIAVSAAAPVAFALAVGGLDAPADGRPDRTFPARIIPTDLALGSRETPDYLALDRRRLFPGVLPRIDLDRTSPPVAVRSVERLIADLGRPGIEAYERPTPDLLTLSVIGTDVTVAPLSIQAALAATGEGGTPELRPFAARPPDAAERMVDVELDLSRPPLLSEEPLRIADGDAGHPGASDPLVLDGSRPFLVTPFDVPWSEHPESLAAARDRFGTVYLVFVAGRPRPVSRVHPIRPERIDAGRFEAGRVRLRLPEGEVVRLIEVRSYKPMRWYSRWAVVRDGEVIVSDPVPMSPT